MAIFEDEIKRLLGKRWVATGGVPLRTNVNGATSTGAALNLPGSGANSGASTPYGHPGPRSGLGATVFAEEDEDELELDRNGVSSTRHLSPGGFNNFLDPNLGGRLRTSTGSTIDTIGTHHTGGSGNASTSTAFTIPDIGIAGAPGSGNGATTPSTAAPLVPVTPLPTAEAETQIGWSKVAESDFDGFMTYASIVPEYYRLENILIKGII